MQISSFKISGFTPNLHGISDPIVFLNSNGQGDQFLAIGKKEELILWPDEPDVLKSLDRFTNSRGKWIFGFLSYDLKNEIEKLDVSVPQLFKTPLAHLIVPEIVIRWNKDGMEVSGEKDGLDLSAIFAHSAAVQRIDQNIPLSFRISEKEYIESVESLKRHIAFGNIYEINFCQELGAIVDLPESYQQYLRLNEHTRAPFSAFLRLGNLDVMCASPERFLRKRGSELISQPIKGTARRSFDAAEDNNLKDSLHKSEKDRMENVMIVDLVRNDLSRFAQRGSVKVDELYGVHTFKTVHHLISTITCEVPEEVSFADIIKATFPMGSMTGAPKISSMNLIDSHESSCRGLYSGTIGYMAPNGDFDFNVVIRSLIYHRSEKYLSCSAGGAITTLSDAKQEHIESLLKAEAIQRSLSMQ
ncbi:MAG: anthranilate synthase component I family protein [Flavobacteriales bacterium]|nr:anthranilate synthase component I family protein [Flavobacteriales bacterium]